MIFKDHHFPAQKQFIPTKRTTGKIVRRPGNKKEAYSGSKDSNLGEIQRWSKNSGMELGKLQPKWN